MKMNTFEGELASQGEPLNLDEAPRGFLCGDSVHLLARAGSVANGDQIMVDTTSNEGKSYKAWPLTWISIGIVIALIIVWAIQAQTPLPQQAPATWLKMGLKMTPPCSAAPGSAPPPPCSAAAPAAAQRVDSKFGYVTALSGLSQEYLVMLYVWAYSLRKTGTEHDLILIIEPQAWNAAQPREQELLQMLFDMIVFKEGDPIAGSERSMMGGGLYFFKMWAWSLSQYDKLLWLGIDGFALRSLDHVFGIEPPAAPRDQWLGTKASVFGPAINGDYILFRPLDTDDFERFTSLMGWLRNYPKLFSEVPTRLPLDYYLPDSERKVLSPTDYTFTFVGPVDQGMLQSYYGPSMTILPAEYQFQVPGCSLYMDLKPTDRTRWIHLVYKPFKTQQAKQGGDHIASAHGEWFKLKEEFFSSHGMPVPFADDSAGVVDIVPEEVNGCGHKFADATSVDMLPTALYRNGQFVHAVDVYRWCGHNRDFQSCLPTLASLTPNHPSVVTYIVQWYDQELARLKLLSSTMAAARAQHSWTGSIPNAILAAQVSQKQVMEKGLTEKHSNFLDNAERYLTVDVDWWGFRGHGLTNSKWMWIYGLLWAYYSNRTFVLPDYMHSFCWIYLEEVVKDGGPPDARPELWIKLEDLYDLDFVNSQTPFRVITMSQLPEYLRWDKLPPKVDDGDRTWRPEPKQWNDHEMVGYLTQLNDPLVAIEYKQCDNRIAPQTEGMWDALDGISSAQDWELARWGAAASLRLAPDILETASDLKNTEIQELRRRYPTCSNKSILVITAHVQGRASLQTNETIREFLNNAILPILEGDLVASPGNAGSTASGDNARPTATKPCAVVHICSESAEAVSLAFASAYSAFIASSLRPQPQLLFTQKREWLSNEDLWGEPESFSTALSMRQSGVDFAIAVESDYFIAAPQSGFSQTIVTEREWRARGKPSRMMQTLTYDANSPSKAQEACPNHGANATSETCCWVCY